MVVQSLAQRFLLEHALVRDVWKIVQRASWAESGVHCSSSLLLFALSSVEHFSR
jgi:hypothetical protein